MTKHWIFLCGSVVACGGQPERVAATSLELTSVTLEDVGLGNNYGVLFDVNAAGEAVGNYRSPSTQIHAFRWDGGGITDIHPSGSSWSWVQTNNDSGVVAGYFGSGPLNAHAAVWPSGGASNAVIVDTLPSLYSLIGELNASSEAVGTWHDAAGFQRAFYWSTATGTVDIGDLGGVRTIASDINALGQIVGWTAPSNATLGHAVSWQGGVLTDLGTLGGEFSTADDVNDNGLIVGSAQTSTGVWHACQWVDGVITDLDPAGAGNSFTLAVNNSGHVVGFRTIGGQQHATLWRDGGAIDLGAGPNSWGVDINDLDVITGVRWGALGFVWANPADGPVDLPAPSGTTGSIVTALGSDVAVGYGHFSSGDDVRAAVWRLAITPPAPNDAIGVLDDAVDESPLAPGEAHALDSKLEGALHQCARGNETAARNQIEAFIHQVEAFIHSGRLTEEEGQDLIALALTVLDELDC